MTIEKNGTLISLERNSRKRNWFDFTIFGECLESNKLPLFMMSVVLWKVLYFQFGSKSTESKIYFSKFRSETFGACLFFSLFLATATESHVTPIAERNFVGNTQPTSKIYENVRTSGTQTGSHLHLFAFQSIEVYGVNLVWRFVICGTRSLIEWP